MPFVPIPFTCELEVRYLWDGQKVENTLYFETTEPNNAAGLEVLCQEIYGWAVGSMLPLMAQTVELVEVFGRELSVQNGYVASWSQSGTNTGAVTGGSVTNNTALCISFRTGLAGKSYRGRNYVIGTPKSSVTANVVSAAFRDNVESAYNRLPAVVGPYNWVWVVASRYHNNAPRTEGVTTPVTRAVITDLVVDSQRRRLPKRGQ